MQQKTPQFAIKSLTHWYLTKHLHKNQNIHLHSTGTSEISDMFKDITFVLFLRVELAIGQQGFR